MLPRVFVTFPLPAAAATRLRRAARVRTYRGPQPIPRATLLAGVRGADGLLCLLTERVFEDEPHVSAALRTLPNVVLTPHVGSATTATRTAMALLAVRNLTATLAGREPPSRIDGAGTRH